MIDPAQAQQLLVCAPFYDSALVEHQDSVGMAHCAQAVGNHQAGAILHQLVQRFLDQQLGARVDGARRFVEDEDARVLEDHPSDGQQLAVTSAQGGAALSHLGLVSLGQALDEGVSIGHFGGRDHLVIASLDAPIADVLHHRAGKEKSVLWHHADL